MAGLRFIHQYRRGFHTLSASLHCRMFQSQAGDTALWVFAGVSKRIFPLALIRVYKSKCFINQPYAFSWLLKWIGLFTDMHRYNQSVWYTQTLVCTQHVNTKWSTFALDLQRAQTQSVRLIPISTYLSSPHWLNKYQEHSWRPRSISCQPPWLQLLLCWPKKVT